MVNTNNATNLIQNPSEPRLTTVGEVTLVGRLREVRSRTHKRNQFSSVILVAIICSGVGCLSTRRADMAPRQLFK